LIWFKGKPVEQAQDLIKLVTMIFKLFAMIFKTAVNTLLKSA